MARKKSRKLPKDQPSLFGLEASVSPERKEVIHEGNQAEDVMTGAVASDQHADESTGSTAGDSQSPAGSAAVIGTTAAQPPGVSLPPREDQSSPEPPDGPPEPLQIDEEDGAASFFGLSSEPDSKPVRSSNKRTRGLPDGKPEGIQNNHKSNDSMEFYRKLHGFTVEQWTVIQKRTEIRNRSKGK